MGRVAKDENRIVTLSDVDLSSFVLNTSIYLMRKHDLTPDEII